MDDIKPDIPNIYLPYPKQGTVVIEKSSAGGAIVTGTVNNDQFYGTVKTYALIMGEGVPPNEENLIKTYEPYPVKQFYPPMSSSQEWQCLRAKYPGMRLNGKELTEYHWNIISRYRHETARQIGYALNMKAGSVSNLIHQLKKQNKGKVVGLDDLIPRKRGKRG